MVEAWVLSFAAAMPMAKLAAMTREHDTRVWRIAEHHVSAAGDQLDCTGVRQVGVEETSAAKGQDYLSISPIWAPGGWSLPPRDARPRPSPASPLIWQSTGGDPAKVTDTSADMSIAFISGIGQHLPNPGDGLRALPPAPPS